MRSNLEIQDNLQENITSEITKHSFSVAGKSSLTYINGNSKVTETQMIA